jgi:hypothetical protein
MRLWREVCPRELHWKLQHSTSVTAGKCEFFEVFLGQPGALAQWVRRPGGPCPWGPWAMLCAASGCVYVIFVTCPLNIQVTATAFFSSDYQQLQSFEHSGHGSRVHWQRRCRARRRSHKKQQDWSCYCIWSNPKNTDKKVTCQQTKSSTSAHNRI